VAFTLHGEARARGGFARPHRLGAKMYEGDCLSLFWWLCVLWTEDCVWDMILFPDLASSQCCHLFTGGGVDTPGGQQVCLHLPLVYRMIIPVRCFTCGKVKVITRLEQGRSDGKNPSRQQGRGRQTQAKERHTMYTSVRACRLACRRTDYKDEEPI